MKLLIAGFLILLLGVATAKNVAPIRHSNIRGSRTTAAPKEDPTTKSTTPAAETSTAKDAAAAAAAAKDTEPEEDEPTGDVASEFKKAKIDPDIINSVPGELIEIKYGDKEVKLGNELTPTQAKDIPEIHYKHDGGVLYTLVMTDPDVPVRGYNREWQHWVVGNIPEENVAKGEVLTEYVGPAPPKNTGLHRYVFLLYKQNQGSITFDERRIGNRDKRRNRFSVKRFAEKYNLEGPIAGNFLKAKFDDYVPTIQKKIGIYL